MRSRCSARVEESHAVVHIVSGRRKATAVGVRHWDHVNPVLGRGETWGGMSWQWELSVWYLFQFFALLRCSRVEVGGRTRSLVLVWGHIDHRGGVTVVGGVQDYNVLVSVPDPQVECAVEKKGEEIDGPSNQSDRFPSRRSCNV